MDIIPRIVITPGEPAGIGPDVTIQILQQAWPAELIIVCDPRLLQERADQLGIPIKIIEANLKATPTPHKPQTAKVLAVPLNANVTAGKLDSQNAAYVLQCLEIATDLCLKKQAQALVTGPVHKGIMNDANIAFSGHTEFLAQRCGVNKSIMLFVVDALKVALVTTHIPLKAVSENISSNKLEQTIRLLQQELQKNFGIAQPNIVVCGLNPHAGESGHLGMEEIDVIQPTITKLQQAGLSIIGPVPADTAFTPQNLKKTDVVLAMYHDQVLPLIKHIGFDRAVNVTLGLPIIRTSVDHGTALEIAGTQQANPGSLRAAIQLALDLIKQV